MRIFSRFGRFAVLGIQMLNLVPKPLIQVQFLVGTPTNEIEGLLHVLTLRKSLQLQLAQHSRNS